MIEGVRKPCDWVKSVVPWHYLSELIEMVVEIVAGRLLSDVK